MGLLKHRGYSGTVEFNDDDNCLHGKVLGLRNTTIIYEGMSLEEIRKDFEDSVDFYLDSCEDRGVNPEKPYSGKLVLRMPSELHGEVAMVAADTGITINDFINQAVSDKLAKRAHVLQ